MIYFLNGTYNYDYSKGHHIDPSDIFESEQASVWIQKTISKAGLDEGVIDLLSAMYQEDSDPSYLFFGTDNLEEIAFLISITAPAGKKVLLTGAMRPFGHQDYDGIENAKQCFMIDTAMLSDQGGCWIAIGGQLHNGLGVRKAHSTDMSPFRSSKGPEAGFEPDKGWVYHGSKYPPQEKYDLHQVRFGANVPIVTVGLNDDLRYLQSEKLDGLILAAAGTGTIPGNARSALSVIAKSIPVVVTSRCYEGPNYDDELYPGSRESYENDGFILRGYEDLNPIQARLKLLTSMGSN